MGDKIFPQIGQKQVDTKNIIAYEKETKTKKKIEKPESERTSMKMDAAAGCGSIGDKIFPQIGQNNMSKNRLTQKMSQHMKIILKKKKIEKPESERAY